MNTEAPPPAARSDFDPNSEAESFIDKIYNAAELAHTFNDYQRDMTQLCAENGKIYQDVIAQVYREIKKDLKLAKAIRSAEITLGDDNLNLLPEKCLEYIKSRTIAIITGQSLDAGSAPDKGSAPGMPPSHPRVKYSPNSGLGGVGM